MIRQQPWKARENRKKKPKKEENRTRKIPIFVKPKDATFTMNISQSNAPVQQVIVVQ